MLTETCVRTMVVRILSIGPSILYDTSIVSDTVSDTRISIGIGPRRTPKPNEHPDRAHAWRVRCELGATPPGPFPDPSRCGSVFTHAQAAAAYTTAPSLTRTLSCMIPPGRGRLGVAAALVLHAARSRAPAARGAPRPRLRMALYR